MLTILIPMVGEDLYTTKSHISFPNILSEIEGKTLFQYSQLYRDYIKEEVNSIFLRPQSIAKEFNLDSIIRQVVKNNLEIIEVNDFTAGILCTCLLATDFLDGSEELIIVPVDQYINIETQDIIDDFRKTNTDVGLLTFSSIDAKWPYIKRNSNRDIIEMVENKVISSEAVVEFFYFRRSSLFLEAAKKTIMKSNVSNKRFSLSSCINETILLEAKLNSKNINKDDYYNFYDLSTMNDFATRL